MIGGIIGDICGSIYEFNNCKDYDKVQLFGKGCSITDDTVMMIAVAQALMDSIEEDALIRDRADLLVKSMQYYGSLYPCAGYGALFINWLDNPLPKPYGSFGNGSAMRVASAGWLYNSLKDTLKAAEASAEVTHNHPEGIKGAKAIAGAIHLARNHATKERIKTFVEDLGYNLDFTIDGIRDTYQHNETCQDCIPQAVECFLESKDFEDCLKLTISLGGDSDTLADISCSIAEAFYGVPEELEKKALALLPEPLLVQYERFDRRRKAWYNTVTDEC